jgi:hypothetical protein
MNLILGNQNISESFKSLSGVVLSPSFHMESWIRIDPSDVSSLPEAALALADLGKEFETLYVLPPDSIYIKNLSSVHDHFTNSRELASKFSFPAVAATFFHQMFHLKQIVICMSPKFNSLWYKRQRQFLMDYLDQAGIPYEQELFD